MKVIMYAGENRTGDHLKHRIERLIARQELESYDSINGFVGRLRRPMNGFIMAIICAGSQEEFKEILGITDLLAGIKTILVVPDRMPRTLSAALKLHPRYVAYADGDFLDVSLVAERMLQRFYNEEKSLKTYG